MLRRSYMPKGSTPLRRSRMKARRYHRLDTRKGLIDALDEVTSYIVRRRDGRCITCHTTEDLTCSHFYKRRWLHVRFDLRNVACMCMSCNIKHDSNPWPYLNWLHDTYSEDILDELHQLRMSTRKIEDYELRELLESHRATLRTLAGLVIEVQVGT